MLYDIKLAMKQKCVKSPNINYARPEPHIADDVSFMLC